MAILLDIRPRTVADGFRLPESLRWHAGRLWMSDMDGGAVYFVSANGQELVCEVPTQPSGLGWDQEGRLLIVSQLDAALLRYERGSLTQVADLKPAMWRHGGDVRPNDMYVDAEGFAYIGSASFHVVDGCLVGEDSHPTPLVRVAPDGRVDTLTENLRCPNGIVPALSGDGIVVAETRSARLVRIVPGEGDRTSAAVAEYARCVSGPDGMCNDPSGGIWVAFPFASSVQRIDLAGAVSAEIYLGGRVPLDCTLGGPEGTTLLVASVAEIDHLGTSRTGRIDAYELGDSPSYDASQSGSPIALGSENRHGGTA
jgi:sugar lactone lactonase YvrE